MGRAAAPAQRAGGSALAAQLRGRADLSRQAQADPLDMGDGLVTAPLD
ncbi:MAG: hypothetical protein HC875_10220 [Anaerolineales bacterium]|nr:hypothetical protein [Anaerolineales bacterium]